MDATRLGFWSDAAQVDQTLRFAPSLTAALAARELRPVRYARRRLFGAMAHQEPILFHDFPVRDQLAAFFAGPEDPAEVLRRHISPARTTMTRLGPSERVRHLPIHRVLDMWRRNRARLAAIDIHLRGLRLGDGFDYGAIREFNILRDTPPRISRLEVATLLLCTSSCMTDSHSDDPDGTNHCVRGRKLWVVWDRREGQAAGLQDCEYDAIDPLKRQARFSVRAFLKVPSARWFTVSGGQTLFMPGHLTHKVITLERYLGISSFYVTLPNALSSLSRWILRGTRMITDRLRHEIAGLVRTRLAAMARASDETKARWGFDHIGEALARWERRHDQAERERLMADPGFRAIAGELRAACAHRGFPSQASTVRSTGWT
jgi:hypothetical protein